MVTNPKQIRPWWLLRWFQRKDSIFAIAYFASGADFDKYRPVVEKMIDSFKISAKGPVIQEDNSSSSEP